MIKFPETAEREWRLVAEAADVERQLRVRIKRDILIELEVEKMRVRHAASVQFDTEIEAENTPTLEMFTVDQFKATPSMAPTDLIDGIMKDKGLMIVMGPSGSGKSTLALQALYCLMTGEDFLARPVTKVDGAVGVLSYDMDGGLTADWLSGFPNVDTSQMSVVNAYKRGNPLAVPSMRAQIVAAWKALAVDVVLIDSFSASFFGENQNDTASTMAHYRDLIKFALTEVGARGLMVVSHSTSSSPYKIRGSTAHHDVADSIMAVVAQADGSREVRPVKYRQHRTKAGVMSHQMDRVMIGAPDDVTHLVDIDTNAMVLADLTPPVTAAAQALFPDEHEAPDIKTDSEGEDEDL